MGSPYANAARSRRRRIDEGSRRGPSATCFSSGSLAAIPADPTDPTDPAKNARTTRLAIPTGENFATCYMELCKQQRIRPLPVICVTLPHSLDLTTDRVKMDDWGPILDSLSLDRSLKSVSVRSRYQCRKPLEEVNSEVKARSMSAKRKEPVVLTRYLLEWLSHSVAQCLRNSRALTWLELEGVPFPPDCLAALCVGLAGTDSLRHLSLRRCCIGDAGCGIVCRTVADLRSLRTLDLSECDLGEHCATALAAALSRQKLSLYQETWKESLRYREPDLEAMPGLRRLTLNGNPRLGDRAVVELIEAVRDSLWLKALDLQHCGLTDFVGQEIVRLLEHNTTLAIVDVRMNWNLTEETLKLIFERLEANGEANAPTSGKSAYVWMSLTRKDQRNAVSAGGTRRNRHEDLPTRPESASKARPKSAFTRKGRAYGTDGAIRATRTCAPVTRTEVVGSAKAFPRSKNNDGKSLLDLKPAVTQPRVSLRLDLQSRIEAVVGATMPEHEQSDDKEVVSNIVTANEQDEPEKSTEARNETVPLKEEEQGANTTKVYEILRELSEARVEQERLVEETKKTDTLLAEERARREEAESKLLKMKEDLADLETALKNKERETRGFLLVSQRSLDDIAASFDRLLKMLESVASKETEATAATQTARPTDDEFSVARAEIRNRFAHLIRKTKSESHGARGFRVEREESTIIEGSSAGSAKKFARSEGDVTGSALPTIVQPIRLERNIGDSPDVVSSRTRITYRETSGKEDSNRISEPCPPCERARALFARIVNGDTVLHLRGEHGS